MQSDQIGVLFAPMYATTEQFGEGTIIEHGARRLGYKDVKLQPFHQSKMS